MKTTHHKKVLDHIIKAHEHYDKAEKIIEAQNKSTVKKPVKKKGK